MNTIIFSLIISSIIAFFVLIFDNSHNENGESNKTAKFFQIMLVSFICVYIGITYLYNDEPNFIFDKGDAPF